MLNSGEKIRALRDKKNNILTLVLSKKNFLNETKNHTPPPFQVKWSVPNANGILPNSLNIAKLVLVLFAPSIYLQK